MDESSNDRMERYESLAEQERQYRTEKESVLDSVGDDLTEAVETATEEEGTNVAVESTSGDGTTQTLTARLDRAALVARILDELPPGFTLKTVNGDGTITVEWDRRNEHSPEQRAKAILKAIVSEELEIGADDLITSVPSREEVIQRATELDVPEDLAADRLARLETLDIVDIDNGKVFPGSNFSKI